MSDRERRIFEPVATELDFPAEEARVLAFWKERGVFARSLRAETRHTGPARGTFSFYEGPPTANGMPHNGHVLTRCIKDLLPRYRTMCGYDVPRKAGWDTHGLPVEVEVEKDLGIHGKADIEAYGVEPFIARCIESVFRYTEAWERNTEKIGYWIDLGDAYVTYHQSYVESVWWALAELHRKGLLYRGHRVCWWWPQGGTALSAAEVGSNYKTVDDPSCYVALELVDAPGSSLCVWTTTPWTLPSNGYAAVHPGLEYVEVEHKGGSLVVAAALREALAQKFGAPLAIKRALRGAELVGRRYRPCFDTFARLFDRTAELASGEGSVPVYWRVIAGDFVTLDAGTGVVHVAPAFGEDDNLAHKAELRRYRDPDAVPLLCAVAPDGTLTADAGIFAGKYVKDADPLIVEDLRARGRLVHFETHRHDYPFCWRAENDPLIQLARPGWYIRTTQRIRDAIACNRAVRWLPEHIRDGRFGDFLENNVDWALSRERFWGTPLNVWVCERDPAHELAPASVAEIERLRPGALDHFRRARARDPSLNEHLGVHKPWIDQVLLPCPACGAEMRRAPEVIDAWFDSGCMPFAQFGFPHVAGSRERFDAAWPADFISEAIDQTRGWFYSLLMVSTMVFDEETCRRVGLAPRAHPHPYRACVVLGHVCDREGKKESKSKGNYTPPDIILERVRMELAVVRAGAKARPAPGVALIARQDYDGLDLAGESAEVALYREGQPPRSLTVEPHKGLPRRVVVLHDDDIAERGLSPVEAREVKPSDVARLGASERVWLEDTSRPAPGADAFRWFFYASSPPWTNTRHSLTNVRELQKGFLIKLRNVYSFFCIYANIDGFDPAADNPGACGTTPADLAASRGYRPARERERLDRWILSEVALAVREVRARLDDLMVYEAAQRLGALVDALSNWYVRRSRDRFWAPASDPSRARDKLDASFTLYECLVTIAKLAAPFVPFAAERMYQNLVRRPWPRSQPESVHLCAYPEHDEAAVDERLSGEMRLVRELVSLGLQVRTDNKLRVRQPLRRADVVVADDEMRARLGAYAGLIADELNVKELTWLAAGAEGAAVSYQIKPSYRALGPRLGKRVQAVKQALAELDAGALRSELAIHGRALIEARGEGAPERIEIAASDVEVAVVAAPGFAAAGGSAGVVVLHTALDDALLDEGLARDLVNRVQAARKQLGLDFTDRIRLEIRGSDRLRRVVEAHRETLMSEALCTSLETGEPASGGEAGTGAWVDGTVADEDVALRIERA
jgi:isoleucyl-tRNA synthetase